MQNRSQSQAGRRLLLALRSKPEVRVRSIDGVADAVQEVEGLKKVAGALRCCGLVQVDEENRVFGMHQLLQQGATDWKMTLVRGMEIGWRASCLNALL
jgi:hypothetical protein